MPGIEFRSVTVEALKGKHGPCFERKQAIIYKGPFKEVLDDDGHRLRRGERTAVCDKTFQIYRKEPYASHVEFVEPLKSITLADAEPFDGARDAPRHPRERKGLAYEVTTEASGQLGRTRGLLLRPKRAGRRLRRSPAARGRARRPAWVVLWAA